jgi:hypothetical protein
MFHADHNLSGIPPLRQRHSRQIPGCGLPIGIILMRVTIPAGNHGKTADPLHHQAQSAA